MAAVSQSSGREVEVCMGMGTWLAWRLARWWGRSHGQWTPVAPPQTRRASSDITIAHSIANPGTSAYSVPETVPLVSPALASACRSPLRRGACAIDERSSRHLVTMKFAAAVAAACLSLLPSAFAHATSNATLADSSEDILPTPFKPPQVFKNANLVHIISLEKNYAKESINVVIENISPDPQDEYFLPFTTQQMEKIGAFEVKDRKDEDLAGFEASAVEFDPSSDTQFYRIKLPAPLPSKGQQTLGISYYLLDSLSPLPAAIKQTEKQYLSFAFSAYCASAYPTSKQKTELKMPSSDVPDYTKVLALSPETTEYPTISGSKLTYGPFTDVPAGATSPAKVRYQFNKPVTHVANLERDIEVSHWGGNVAVEERYTLLHHGASLANNFNRVQWASSAYFDPKTFALKELKIPLSAGTKDAYFTDVIGNVSTSRFRAGKRENLLELKPRYPIFGGWKYPFTIGWNIDSSKYLKNEGSSHVLRVPFLEGPKQSEGIEYEHVDVRVILPEGASNVKYSTSAPTSSVLSASEGTLKTYLDTFGRTVLTIKARNLVDELRDRELVVTYDYSTAMALRKPWIIFTSMMTVFAGLWFVSKIPVSFSPK
ncbi:oligosaccharyltransferase alpha subunit [Xylariaceae sp. FL1019]|nr:oligosaccharyltransferase alpha subunit [Xylariaceae sp. FL1019]